MEQVFHIPKGLSMDGRNSPAFRICVMVISGIVVLLAPGCKRPKITAIPLTQWNQCEPEGIPYYLPKPLLIIAKNFQPIENTPVGQMGAAALPTGDAQAGYGAVSAQVSSGAAEAASKAADADAKKQEEQSKKKESDSTPIVALANTNAPPSDLLSPEYFYTYQIVFVPDLSQKYGLRIRGGAGEFRAAMNMVNGWMFTGLGPYMFKDSSTAQNLMAGGISVNFAGRGVAEVVRSIGSLGSIEKSAGDGKLTVQEADNLINKLNGQMEGLELHKIDPIKNYAEIHIYEPRLLPDGSMAWEQVVGDIFDRQFIGTIVRATPERIDPGLPKGATEGTPVAKKAEDAPKKAVEPRPGSSFDKK